MKRIFWDIIRFFLSFFPSLRRCLSFPNLALLLYSEIGFSGTGASRKGGGRVSTKFSGNSPLPPPEFEKRGEGKKYRKKNWKKGGREKISEKGTNGKMKTKNNRENWQNCDSITANLVFHISFQLNGQNCIESQVVFSRWFGRIKKTVLKSMVLK